MEVKELTWYYKIEKMSDSIDQCCLESKCLSEDQKTVLEHYVNEWKMINQYVNEIDRGYEKYLTTTAMLCGGILTLLALISESSKSIFQEVFAIVPFAFLAIFGVLSYQFRITAILRGHAARLEDEMNKILGKNIYLWNSALMETYLAHKCVPSQFLIIPILVLLGLTAWFCIRYTRSIWSDKWYLIYWGIVMIFAVCELLPFFRNRFIRHKTYSTEGIMEQYYKYRSRYIESAK